MFQLADWITKLQPHFTAVWIHLAWNMAYNISIKFNQPHDRWIWVKRGLELLRDDAIRYNPQEPLLYRELGWIFQHKIGYFLDDAHDDYKQYWAAEMNTVFNTQKPNFEELIHPTTPDAERRSKLLREKYKMDPVFMQKVDKQYGPLEWRLPESHAIYWGAMGLEKTTGDSRKQEDFITLRRLIFQSLQMAFHRGRLIYPKAGDPGFTYAPNLEIVKQASDAYEEMARLEPDKNEHILTGHRNFLGTAVYFLYTHNRMAAAKEWFGYMKLQYPAYFKGEADVDQYALSRVAEDIGETDPNRVKAILEGMLETSFINLATGEDDQATGYELFARKIWNRYQEAIGKTSLKRVGLPPLPELKRLVLERILEPDFGLDPVILGQLRTRLNITNSVGTNLPTALPGLDFNAARTNAATAAPK